MTRRLRNRGESLVLCLALCIACREGWSAAFCTGNQLLGRSRSGRVDVTTLTTAAAESPVLDPNVKYLYGADGEVLMDLASKKPLEDPPQKGDNWFNAACGFQAQMIKNLDQGLRFIGLQQAFGWAVLAYTFFIKVLLYPLEKPSLRTLSLSKMLAPKMADMKEKITEPWPNLSFWI
eukprot:s750_g7.t1